MKIKNIKILTYIITFIIFLPIYLLYIGWCYLMMYNWFLIPLGLPSINIYHMIGIALSIQLIIKSPYIPKNRDNKSEGLVIIFFPIITVLLGYIIKTLMVL